jgi:hypothetical protein
MQTLNLPAPLSWIDVVIAIELTRYLHGIEKRADCGPKEINRVLYIDLENLDRPFPRSREL